MATKYDYKNKNFCARILLRKEIGSLNAQISGIVKNEDYDYHEIFRLVMRSFYGGTNQRVINNFEQNLSPIDTFSLPTLKLYRDYLTSVINNYETKDRSLIRVIDECGARARHKGEKLGALPEDFANIDTRLPKSITGAMVKKASALVKKADLQNSQFINNLLNKEIEREILKEVKAGNISLNSHPTAKPTKPKGLFQLPKADQTHVPTPTLENGELNMDVWREKFFYYQLQIEKIKVLRKKEEKEISIAHQEYKMPGTYATARASTAGANIDALNEFIEHYEKLLIELKNERIELKSQRGKK